MRPRVHCKNVLVRDVTIFHGGHFAMPVTGCDNLTVDKVTLDTQRDGMDIDCCRNAMVSNGRVNSADGTMKPGEKAFGRIKFGTARLLPAQAQILGWTFEPVSGKEPCGSAMNTIERDKFFSSHPADYEPNWCFRKSITNAVKGIHVDSWSVSQKQLPLAARGDWSVRKYSLAGGRQTGVDMIEVDNGSLRFVVIPSRGMSILRVDSGDVRLGWDSPVKEVIHPNFINLDRRGGLGWLEGFNEWLVRCGLEWAGHPGRDRFLSQIGDEVEMELTLHGRIGNIPASEVEVLIEAGSPPRIHVRGLVEERMFHGPQLSLWAGISTEIGSHTVRLEDTVTNHGAHDQEFQIIYHANFGPPLLEAGARFLGAVRRVAPFNAHAARDVGRYAEYSGPKPGCVEQVYCLQPLADAEGNGFMMLQNAAADRAVSLAFPVSQLPCFTLWKNLAGTAEGYVTGLEPGTGYPYNRRLERAAGRVPKLASQQTRRFRMDVTIHPDRESVAAAQAQVRIIQGSIEPELDAAPRPT